MNTTAEDYLNCPFLYVDYFKKICENQINETNTK